MNRPGPVTKLATAFAAASLLFSSAASAAPVRAADFVVSASLVNASAQAAVCTTGTASAAAAGAAVAQAVPAQPGCVLPVVDAAQAPVADLPPAAVYVPTAEGPGGIGILPLLLGLAAVAGIAWLLLDEDGEDEILLPISPG